MFLKDDRKFMKSRTHYNDLNKSQMNKVANRGFHFA